MKPFQLKQIIKEEIAIVKLSLTEQSIVDTISSLYKTNKLHESILGSILGIFLDSKYKKKAEEFKNSEEYKELTHQIDMSTKSLNYLTSKLKIKIDDYEKGLKSMQKAGINVKPGMPLKSMWKEYEKWKVEASKDSNLSKGKLIAINPEWEKILK
jgi:hypothetical protein